MCDISTSLKFCTCSFDEENWPDNYWILYRFNPDKDIDVVGEVRLPPDWMPNFKANSRSICRILNQGAAFDKKMEFEEGDVLEVRFRVNGETMECEFTFKKGRWKSDSTDGLTLMNLYDEKDRGIMESVLKPGIAIYEPTTQGDK